LYISSFIILYYDQKIHNYFTNYHTATLLYTGHIIDKYYVFLEKLINFIYIYIVGIVAIYCTLQNYCLL